MEPVNLEPGDVLVTRGTGWLSKAIRVFTRRIGESRTKVNHVGLVVEGGPLEEAWVVEALWKVVRRRLVEGYGSKRSPALGIFRPTNLSEEEIRAVVAAAEGYVGRRYGVLKLVAHLADWVLQGAYVFRRLTNDDRYPICSWLVAHAFKKAGKHFGVAPGAASPDDVWDFCVANPDKYTVVLELSPLHPHLSGSWAPTGFPT
jgi:hypothetical protein